MAYGLKYTSTFFQVKSYSTTGEWLINIYLEGYGGATTEFKTVKNSIKRERTGDFKDVIRPTTLTFDVFNQTESQFLEFASANWGDYKVELIYDPNGTPITKYIGYNQTEIYIEPLQNLPYPTSLSFTDGLKHLEYIRWDNSGTLYTGQKAIIETLRLALNKLPSPLAIREVVNVYEDSINSTTADSMLAQIYTDSAMYKEDIQVNGSSQIGAYMANSVIDEVLKPLYCQIYQENGIWYIVRKQEYKGTVLYYRDFNANVGTESTLTVNGSGTISHKRSVTNANTLTTDIIMPSASAEKEIIPPINRIKLTYTQQNLDYEEYNIVTNGNFFNISTPSGYYSTHNGVPNIWQYTGVDLSTYYGLIRNVATGRNAFRFKPADYQLSTAYNSNIYISQTKTNMPVASVDTIQLSFNLLVRLNLAEIGTGNSTTPFLNYFTNSMTTTTEILVSIGSYYLAGDNINGYSWSLVSQNAKYITIGSGVPIGYGYWGYGYQTIIENVINLPLLPVTSLVSFEFRLYQPYTDVPSYDTSDVNFNVDIDYITYDDIKLLYLPDATPPLTELLIYADINEDENVEEISVIHGDGGSTISQGSYRVNGGVITDSWTRRGITETLPILEILINSIRDDNGDFKNQINCKLIGEFEAYTSLIVTLGGVAKIYILDTYTEDLENNEWDCALIETATFTNTFLSENVGFGVAQPKVVNVPVSQQNITFSSDSVNLINYTETTTATADQTNLTNFN